MYYIYNLKKILIETTQRVVSRKSIASRSFQLLLKRSPTPTDRSIKVCSHIVIHEIQHDCDVNEPK